MKLAGFTKSTTNGFTIVEMLVAISVAALLLAILLPALLLSREASRRINCASNLKQLLIAESNYYEVFQAFPTLSNTGSVWFRLQPWLEVPNVPQSANGTNYTPKFLQCPSDFDPFGDRYINYAINFGTATTEDLNGLLIGGHNNRFTMADVSDGASNTAYLSEFVRGKSNSIPIDRRDFRPLIFDLQVDPAQVYDPVTRANQIQACDGVDPKIAPIFASDRGNQWAFAVQQDFTYTHASVPGHKSCSLNGGALAWTASSQHYGGVEVGFLDGAVKFISNSVNLDVWRAIGSRNGNEVVDGQL